MRTWLLGGREGRHVEGIDSRPTPHMYTVTNLISSNSKGTGQTDTY